MRIGRRDIGAVLAFLAGLSLLGWAAWPLPSRQLLRWGDLGPVWLVGALVIAGIFLAAPFLVDRRPVLTKFLLVGGAVALVASGFLFGGILQGGLPSAVMDILPAVLALLAAVIIRPAGRPGGDRGREAANASRPSSPS